MGGSIHEDYREGLRTVHVTPNTLCLGNKNRYQVLKGGVAVQLWKLIRQTCEAGNIASNWHLFKSLIKFFTAINHNHQEYFGISLSAKHLKKQVPIRF